MTALATVASTPDPWSKITDARNTAGINSSNGYESNTSKSRSFAVNVIPTRPSVSTYRTDTGYRGVTAISRRSKLSISANVAVWAHVPGSAHRGHDSAS